MTEELKKYGIKYAVQAGSFTKEDADVKAGKAGLTDAILIVSVVGEGASAHEGSKSFALMHRDGRGVRDGELNLAEAPELKDTELFQIMTVIADHLVEKDNPEQPSWQRDLCAAVMQATREILRAIKDKPTT